eukprot:364362-Chlamydomonas_euryale.AAC.28
MCCVHLCTPTPHKPRPPSIPTRLSTSQGRRLLSLSLSLSTQSLRALPQAPHTAHPHSSQTAHRLSLALSQLSVGRETGRFRGGEKPRGGRRAKAAALVTDVRVVACAAAPNAPSGRMHRLERPSKPAALDVAGAASLVAWPRRSASDPSAAVSATGTATAAAVAAAATAAAVAAAGSGAMGSVWGGHGVFASPTTYPHAQTGTKAQAHIETNAAACACAHMQCYTEASTSTCNGK